MRSIPAQEIKRRGIGAVDALLQEGPVHVITRNEPRYVIMDERQYREMIAEREEAYLARVQAVRREIAKGHVLHFSNAAELLAAIDAADDDEDDEGGDPA